MTENINLVGRCQFIEKLDLPSSGSMIVDIDAAGSGIDVNLNVYLYPVHITYCLMAVYDSIE